MGAWPPRGRPVANAPRGPGDRSASGGVHQIAAAVSPHVGSTRACRPVAARQARGPVVVRSGRNPSAGSDALPGSPSVRSEEQTYELQSLMRISYAVFCLKKTTKIVIQNVLHIYTNETTYSITRIK